MSVSFRPAVRSNVNLLIGLAGASGSGKTYTGMRLASGMAEGKRFCVIDTENGRASHYADQFQFDVAELREPYTPARYEEVIKAADAAGYPVILIDSMSHEWAGHGGILDMQEDELKRLGGGDSVKMLSWAKPKREHKAMMNTLLSVRAHVILCMRAEAKIDMIKENGKTKIVPKQTLTSLDGWIPITEKTVPFELTVSFLLTPDAPGVPKPIKLQQQHKALFPLNEPITEDSGRRIAEWARGGKPSTASTPSHSAGPADAGAGGSDATYVHPDQVTHLGDRLRENAIDPALLLKAAKVPSLQMILAADYPRSMAWIDAAIERKRSA